MEGAVRKGVFTTFLVVVLMSAGCQRCSEEPCAKLEVDSLNASESDSDVTWNGTDMSVAPNTNGEVTDPPHGVCFATLTHRASQAFDDEPPDEVELRLTLRCKSEGTFADITLTHEDFSLSDLEAETQTVTLNGSTTDADGISFQPPSLSISATLSVEESVGTTGPYPNLVSEDLKRVVRYEVSHVGARPEHQVAAALVFTITAGHVHADPDAVCDVCLL